MRVISGSLKGKPINYLKNSITRPLKDIVKEGVFNTLKHSNLINAEIKNSNILDIYSGIGSFGIECISCGAHKVTFVEKDIEAVNILNQNLNNLSILNKSKIIKSKIESFLTENINEKFNIFFLDPPFKDKSFIQNLKLIKNYRIFSSDHTVIIHRERKTEDNFNNLLKIVKIKQYGRSKIIFGEFI
jgi:16S rRNA (guanine966-N2)-methyltransferase